VGGDARTQISKEMVEVVKDKALCSRIGGRGPYCIRPKAVIPLNAASNLNHEVVWGLDQSYITMLTPRTFLALSSLAATYKMILIPGGVAYGKISMIAYHPTVTDCE
jgi:hypothetical protein